MGRPTGFDPQSDSTVRVQAGRLRVKLAEYYAQEGVDDPILVEIPKGSYALTFHVRTMKGATHPAATLIVETPEKKVEALPSTRAWAIVIVVLLVLLASSFITSAILLSQRTRAAIGTPQSVPGVYQIFWNHFVASSQPPWVIFSNGSFVGRPETGMRYYNPESDSHAFILDHYTGVGEVLAIHQLDHIFYLFNRQLRVKRGALFSLDDAKNNDLIFVGSPSENLTLGDLPGTKDFVFQRLDSGPRKGDLAVVNVHPLPGEPKTFEGTPANRPTTEDYAVVSLLPGLDPSHAILILAGNTTFGTQAAVEYVCREDSLSQLLHRLNVSKEADLKPFEALLHVNIVHGVPVTTELISVRTRGN
ncbi:MAG: hypothetical protein WAM79_21635 [Candidatus Sulfotelmatobacter sp.]